MTLPQGVAHTRRQPIEVSNTPSRHKVPCPSVAPERAHGFSVSHCCISSTAGMYLACAWPVIE